MVKKPIRAGVYTLWSTCCHRCRSKYLHPGPQISPASCQVGILKRMKLKSEREVTYLRYSQNGSESATQVHFRTVTAGGGLSSVPVKNARRHSVNMPASYPTGVLRGRPTPSWVEGCVPACRLREEAPRWRLAGCWDHPRQDLGWGMSRACAWDLCSIC